MSNYQLFNTSLVLFPASMTMMSAGLEYGWMSASLPILLARFNNESEAMITSEEGVWVATIALPGGMLGSLTGGFLSNPIGRRTVILLTSVPFTVHWVLLSLAEVAFVFYIARFLGGFASGMILTASPMYIGEICNPKIRGWLSAATPVCIASGVFLMNLFQLWMSFRHVSLLSIVFPVGGCFGLLFMPESPYFYLIKGKESKALKTLRIFRGVKDADESFPRIKEAAEEQKEAKNRGCKALFTIATNRRSLLILLMVRGLQPLCGITTFVYYCGVIFEEAGTDISARDSTIIFSSAMMTSACVSAILVDRLGRRILLLTSISGALVGILIASIFFQCKYSGYDVSSYTYIPLVSLTWTIFSIGFGLNPIPYVIQGELFATGVKHIASTLGFMTFCISSLSAAKYFQVMNDYLGPHYAFYTFAAFNITLFTVTFIFLPETKGISLEDVQLMMIQRKKYFKDVDRNVE